ncbi:MarR family winged helix-turn-helix transcriptional regulator [Paenibacillus methanolicus]|uniref:DNA-binding MarR family transcriptional regulator n=1 Tax=Paenibacillus methanolicus TaxID=582686 RepID=A0A5S5BTP7_9BACL|nr:MarR family transcriptional regulator [Paenibacillus methanolicus]TYP69582.1 DNA-binding MarR family transcriptional regulator [Paenibacillus methanolicus]
MNHHLDEHIGILIRDVDLAISGYVKRQLAPLGLAPEQSLILLLLYREDGLPQHEIALRLRKDKTNVNRMIDNLEGKGVVIRRSDRADRRVQRVWLTEQGRALEEQVLAMTERTTRLLTEGFAPEELEAGRRFLERVRHHLQQTPSSDS